MDDKHFSKRGSIKTFDVDIDFADRDQALKHVNHVAASMWRDSELVKHNTGVYFNDIPQNPALGISAIDYKTAEARGYFKIDFLNVSVYRMIRDLDHYEQMLNKEPVWSRLWLDPVWTTKLIHIGSYPRLLKHMKPSSVLEMAAFISIIRPGKAHLQYQPWQTVFETVWDGNDSQGYVFKRSHALSYATLVVLHMNLLEELEPAARGFS